MLAMSNYLSGERTLKVQKQVADVSEIIANAKMQFADRNFVGLTTSLAVKTKVIPLRLAGANDTAQADWGGAITLEYDSSNTIGLAQLTYVDVPREICTPLILGTAKLAVFLWVNSPDQLGKTREGVVSVADVDNYCQANPTSSVTWVIGKGYAGSAGI